MWLDAPAVHGQLCVVFQVGLQAGAVGGDHAIQAQQRCHFPQKPQAGLADVQQAALYVSGES